MSIESIIPHDTEGENQKPPKRRVLIIGNSYFDEVGYYADIAESEIGHAGLSEKFEVDRLARVEDLEGRLERKTQVKGMEIVDRPAVVFLGVCMRAAYGGDEGRMGDVNLYDDSPSGKSEILERIEDFCTEHEIPIVRYHMLITPPGELIQQGALMDVMAFRMALGRHLRKIAEEPEEPQLPTSVD